VLQDRATLERFRAGDRATLSAVYRAHAKDVAVLASRGFSFRSGDAVHRFFGYREPHAQQDAVQEVFIRAFGDRARASYDGITPYPTYLRAILKNLVVDEFRKRSAALEVFASEEEAENAPSPAEPADVEVQRKRVVDFVQGFVQSLPEREKRFVALRYHDGLAQEDVAAKMGVGRSTVRTLEERVRRRLADSLEKKGITDRASTSVRSVSAGLALIASIAFAFVEVMHA
jgi:RNA polymerase sigma-70 factor (ECF subfamily)